MPSSIAFFASGRFSVMMATVLATFICQVTSFGIGISNGSVPSAAFKGAAPSPPPPFSKKLITLSASQCLRTS